MKDRKRQLENLAFYDKAAIEDRAAHMAEKGWLVEQPGPYFWKYRRIEPKRLAVNVVYFPKASEFDPSPTEGQIQLEELCKRDGWILAARWGQMQIFYNEQKDPVPIETDPVIQVETVRAAMKKGDASRPASAGGTERDAAYDAGLAALGIPGALPFKTGHRVYDPGLVPGPLRCFMRALGVPGLDKAGGERGGKWQVLRALGKPEAVPVSGSPGSFPQRADPLPDERRSMGDSVAGGGPGRDHGHDGCCHIYPGAYEETWGLPEKESLFYHWSDSDHVLLLCGGPDGHGIFCGDHEAEQACGDL